MKTEDYPALIHVGSCSLDAVHWAFWNGEQKAKWSIDSVLKWLHNMYDDALAKRGDYTNLTGIRHLSITICGHQWFEDKKVAGRAIMIWPNINQYVTETLKKPKNRTPLSVSFTTVNSAVHGHLMVAVSSQQQLWCNPIYRGFR